MRTSTASTSSPRLPPLPRPSTQSAWGWSRNTSATVWWVQPPNRTRKHALKPLMPKSRKPPTPSADCCADTTHTQTATAAPTKGASHEHHLPHHHNHQRLRHDL